MATPPPLEVLYEAAEDQTTARRCLTVPRLISFYGGNLTLPERSPPAVIANFVSTIDGVISFDPDHARGAAAVSAGSDADRLMMAVLRAAVDVIVVGASTLRVTTNHRWTAEHLVPELAGDLRAARSEMTGRSSPAPMVVVSATGNLPASHPALATGSGAVVVTTDEGAARARQRGVGARILALPEPAQPVSGEPAVAGGPSGSDPPADTGTARSRQPLLDGAAILDAIDRELSPRLVLTEGGPLLLGSLLGAGRVDELFLTVTPIIAGRDRRAPRPGLVDGFAPPSTVAPHARALSVRRAPDGAMLFRYAIHSAIENAP